MEIDWDSVTGRRLIGILLIFSQSLAKAYQVAVGKTRPVGVGKADTRQSCLPMLYRYAMK